MASIAIYDGNLYFTAKNDAYGEELWMLNGDTEEVKLAVDILPGPDSGSPNQFSIHKGKLYFAAEHYAGSSNSGYLHRYSSKTNTVSRAQLNTWNKDEYVKNMQSIQGLLYVTSRGSRTNESGWFEGVWAYNDVTDTMIEVHTNGKKTSSAIGGSYGRSWFTYYLGSIYFGAYDTHRRENKRIVGFYGVDLVSETTTPLIPEVIIE